MYILNTEILKRTFIKGIRNYDSEVFYEAWNKDKEMVIPWFHGGSGTCIRGY